MVHRNPLPASILVLLFVAATALGESSSGVDLNNILDHMEQAQAQAQKQEPAYSVTRAYKFYAKDPKKPSSQVIARVDYQPPATKSFSIQQASGNSEGQNIVKRVLERETKPEDAQHSCAINRANYDFKYLRTEDLNGQPAYVLQITPKKKDKDRIAGQIWVDRSSYLVRRVEGDLSKSPSLWIKDVHLVLTYGRMAGVWVQTAVLAVADVRFLGSHTMLAQVVGLQPAFALAHATAAPAYSPAGVHYARLTARNPTRP